uniref:Mon2/Sec7/BIG1-like dimerisation and cyclophilin-binding domain-containing protein n=1 Tax=Aquila chrysaetos chrysaetos TaxID=223781 RepID=A0A663DMI7_AQUCH
MSGTSSPEAVKKLLENMQGDLRGLSLECRKKFPPQVDAAAESGIIKVKTIAARNADILAGNDLQCNGKNKLGYRSKC